MRKALNENPLVQIGLLSALALVVAVAFLIRMSGGEESPPATAGAPAGGEPAASATGTAAPPATPANQAPAESGSTGGASTGSKPAEPEPAPAGTAIEPTEGLPATFARAYERGDTVAIFVLRDEPVSDKVVAGYANRLRGDGGVTVFAIEPSELADWVRVTGPVGVDRTPAMITVSPQTKAGGAEPRAAVSYGFRNFESVRQAVADARYDGPVRGYDPD